MVPRVELDSPAERCFRTVLDLLILERKGLQAEMIQKRKDLVFNRIVEASPPLLLALNFQIQRALSVQGLESRRRFVQCEGGRASDRSASGGKIAPERRVRPGRSPQEFQSATVRSGSGCDRQLFGLTAGKPTLKVRFPKAATGW